MPRASPFQLPDVPPAGVSPASTCLAAVSAPPLPGVLALWLLIAAHNSTSREVSRCPTHTHTYTMPAQWAHSRLSSCLRHLLLRLQLRLQTPKLPRCRADCGFREQPAVRNFKGLFCLSLERQKGMKAAGMGCGVAGTFTSVSPSICPSAFLPWSQHSVLRCCCCCCVWLGFVLCFGFETLISLLRLLFFIQAQFCMP